MKFDRQLQPATETSYFGKKNNSKMADGRHFENRYIAISHWKIIRFLWNFVHCSRFWTGWTSRDQKWKSCIGQTPSSTERSSCLFLVFCFVFIFLTFYFIECCLVTSEHSLWLKQLKQALVADAANNVVRYCIVGLMHLAACRYSWWRAAVTCTSVCCQICGSRNLVVSSHWAVEQIR